jgi:hypothetical protein
MTALVSPGAELRLGIINGSEALDRVLGQAQPPAPPPAPSHFRQSALPAASDVGCSFGSDTRTAVVCGNLVAPTPHTALHRTA